MTARPEYDADDDVTKSFEVAYETIRERVAARGPGWTPKPAQPVTLIIDGPPVAKARPRLGKHGNVYTSAATRAYENMVRQLAALEMRTRPPLQGPMKVEILIELEIPPSWSQARRLAAIAGEIVPASRPDIDNYVKAALDGINTIIIGDDAQIVELRARKKFGGQPKLIMTVIPLAASSNRRARS